ncbi:AAA family ATPase [Flavobacterium sp. RNTU_13]|uniref:AAA family ATPase n=1 Tax=Flavobacterium sp. RNTU_13 TaxID=3375145 RepID=UPI003985975C
MKEVYITRAILKDYLTIKEVNITFNKGINIIIGKNGTGKTNFINYLTDSLQLSPEFSNSEVNFSHSDEIYTKKNISSKYISEDLTQMEINEISLFHNDILIDGKRPILAAIVPVLISHGIPEKYDIADEPFSGSIIKIDGNGGYINFLNPRKTRLVGAIGFDYIANVIFKNKSKADFVNSSVLLKLSSNLNRFSHIKEIRFGLNYKINDIDEEEISFNNLYLEYFVNDEWLVFNQLSDGTKRLFYIISEITLSDKNIILLEEPELGLHPHQLHRLMDFIKEKSEDIQFIITTHSPVVLNILNKDELDGIIIAKFEDGQTKLVHLTDEQKHKAQLYMEDLDLSDYWVHSDLEE